MTVSGGPPARVDDRAIAPAVEVVAVVTSAGGLDALSAVLGGLPEDGPGEIRRLWREMDLAATALGPVTRWPDALRLMARTALDSAYPMAIWSGLEMNADEWQSAQQKATTGIEPV